MCTPLPCVDRPARAVSKDLSIHEEEKGGPKMVGNEVDVDRDPGCEDLSREAQHRCTQRADVAFLIQEWLVHRRNEGNGVGRVSQKYL